MSNDASLVLQNIIWRESIEETVYMPMKEHLGK